MYFKVLESAYRFALGSLAGATGGIYPFYVDIVISLSHLQFQLPQFIRLVFNYTFSF